MTPALATERDWPALMESLGRAVRELRTRLGLSQQELADRAATSQGSISRLESGRHSDLPLLTIVKIALALADGIPPIADAVSPPLRALFALVRDFAPTLGATPPPPPDPPLAALLRAYHALAPARRRAFVELVLPLAAYLGGAELADDRAA